MLRSFCDKIGYRKSHSEFDRGWVDAVVADDPVLRYKIKRANEAGRHSGLPVLPYQFERQNYGLVLREDSHVHEAVDRVKA